MLIHILLCLSLLAHALLLPPAGASVAHRKGDSVSPASEVAARQDTAAAGLPDLDEARNRPRHEPKAVPPVPSMRRRCPPRNRRCTPDEGGKQPHATPTPSATPSYGRPGGGSNSLASVTSTSLLALMGAAMGGGHPVLDVPLLDYFGGEGGYSASDSAPRRGLPPAAVYEAAPEPAAFFQSLQGRVNYALSSGGATATAQNYTADGVFAGLHFQPTYVNDGRRYVGPQGDWYWRDEHGLPSWIEVDFGGPRSIDEVGVFTLADYPAYTTQADPSATQTFTQYGVTSFTVQYWTGSAWATVPGGSVSGNNLVWRKLTFTAVSTSRIRVAVNGAADGVARVTEVEAWGPPPTKANVALASNGGTATAQNYTADGVFQGLHFQPFYANDGRRYVGPQGDWYWRDEHGLPTWVQVDFNGQKVIDEVDIYTLADYPAYMTQADPSATQTFTQYGVTSFEVKYWTGGDWATVQGGSVSGNNLVWRKLTFPAVTTNKIRIIVNGAADGVARVTEVEAWGSGAAGGNGLLGEYYNGDAFNTHRLTRADASVNFDWGGGSPAASVDADFFTARWTGAVVPRYSETYTFYTTTDDGVRLWIDGTNVIDKWVSQAPTEWSGTVTLQAGRHYDLRMEFYEHWGGATAQLRWSSASQAKEVIPQSRLYPPAGGGGGGYDFSTARVDPVNRTGAGGVDPYSRNYNFSIPLVSLPGRAGLDLGLTLSYNSLVWTKDAAGVTFDADEGFPSPGFRLGFPTIQPKFFNPKTQKYAYLLVTPSGARVELRQTNTPGVYESADSSYLQLTEGAVMTLRSTDGARLSLVLLDGSYRCHEVKDRNGNYISVSYWGDGRVNTVTDTLGRVLTFKYDTFQNLEKISQSWKREEVGGTAKDEEHVWASFGYENLTLQPSFSGLTVVGRQAGSVIPVINQVGLADGSYHRFDYNAWGQVWKTTHYAADAVDENGVPNLSHALSARRIDLPGSDLSAASPQADCPRFRQERTWVEYGVMGQSGEVVTTYGDWTPGMASCDVTMPDGASLTQVYETALWRRGLTKESQVWSGGQEKKRTVFAWEHDGADGAPYPTNARPGDITVYDSEGGLRRTHVNYTAFGLPREVSEYAAGAATPLRRTETDYLINPAADAAYLGRRVIGLVKERRVYGLDPSTNVERLYSKFDYRYDWGEVEGTAYLQQQGSPVQHDTAGFGPSFVVGRGNLTSARRWDATSSGSAALAAVATTGYNTDGSVIFKQDPEGHRTRIGYEDRFWSPGGLAGEINRNTFAYPTTVTDPDGFSATSEFNYSMGVVREIRTPLPNVEVNQPGPIHRSYYDGAARLVKVLAVDTGAYKKWEYTQRMDVVKRYTLVETGVESYESQVLDGLGRLRAAASNLPFSNGGYSGQRFEYDVMGRLARQSNPTATNASGAWPATDEDAAYGWLYTKTSYDWMGRPLVITNPTDPATPATTKEFFYGGCGCAGVSLVTTRDEVGRRQRTTYDVLGRAWKTQALTPQPGKPLPFVDDPTTDSPTTVYRTTTNSYDPLDHVTRVVQQAGSGGGEEQVTTFEYDGHGRLSSRKEPEAEFPTRYDYYDDDTLRVMTDARGATATYEYNGRRQRRAITYYEPSGVEPTGNVVIRHDAAGNRLWMTDGPGRVDYEYNSVSQLTAERRFFTLLNRTYRTAYDYNKSGQLTKVIDAFAASFEYKRDGAGRIIEVNGSPYGGVSSYISNVRYRAWGAVKSASYGNNSFSTTDYDARLRPWKHRLTDATFGNSLMREDFSYHADGRLALLTDLNDTGGSNPPATLRFLSRSYSYDLVGRVTGSRGAGGGGQYLPYEQNYAYDEFDHLTYRFGSYYRPITSLEQTETAEYTNNRRDGWEYDKDGRFASSPPTTNGNARRVYYDAEGRQVKTVDTRPGSGGAITYTSAFDGDGYKVYETTFDSANPGGAASYHTLRSTALGGETLTALTPSGEKGTTYVPAERLVFARQVAGGTAFPQTVFFTQRDPVGVTETTKGVYDPLGNFIPFQQPAEPRPPAGSYNSSSMSGLSAGLSDPNSYGTGCRLDGSPADCDRVLTMLNHGAARLDPAIHRGGQNLPPGAPFFPISNGRELGYSDYYLGRLAPGGQPGTEVNPQKPAPQPVKLDENKLKTCIKELFGVDLRELVIKVDQNTREAYFKGTYTDTWFGYIELRNSVRIDTDLSSKTMAALDGAAGVTYAKSPYKNYVARDYVDDPKVTTEAVTATVIHELGNSLGVIMDRRPVAKNPRAFPARSGKGDLDPGAALEECVYGGHVKDDGAVSTEPDPLQELFDMLDP